MYDLETRRRVLALLGEGRSLNSVSRMAGISRSAIRAWRTRIEPARSGTDCTGRVSGPAYAYLLGLHLGDGCISRQPRGGHALRIACADAWPGLIDACEEAMRAVRPGNSVCRAHTQGCTMVTSYSDHWPACSPSTDPAGSTSAASSWSPGSRRSSTCSPGTSCAGSSIPTEAGS